MKISKLIHVILVLSLLAGIHVKAAVHEFNPPECAANTVDLRLAGHG